MKKLLIGTTALVAASVLAAPADASEKIKLGLGGFMSQHAGFSDNSAMMTVRDFDVKGSSEVYFTGSTKLDNGLTVGAKVELEGDRFNGGVIDHSYAWISSGSMGTLYLGSTDGAASKLKHIAPNVGVGLQESDSTIQDWIGAPGAAAIPAGVSAAGVPFAATAATAHERMAWTFSVEDDMAITYISPSFSGFQVGATYRPSTATQASMPGTGTTENWEVAAAYNGKFANASVGVDIGYKKFDTITGGGAVSAGAIGSSTTGNGSNIDVWNVGLKVGFGGFTVGGSYANADTASNLGVDGHVFDLGVSYMTGPYGISLTYMRSDVEATAAAGDDETDFWGLGGSYALGPGVTLNGSILHADYDDEANAATFENDGWAIVAGIKLGF